MHNGVVKFYVGDALGLLELMPDQSVQCIVTSPPFYQLRNYGTPGQLGLEATPEQFVAALVAVFREARRVLKDDGLLWLNLGDSYAGRGRTGGMKSLQRPQSAVGEKGWIPPPPGFKDKDLIGIPWRVAFALQADGWYLRQDIIWYKRNPMPESVRDRCTKAHEYLFMLAKSERYYYDAAAIAEPLASASVDRLSQANLANQRGSSRVPGKTNGTMKAVAKQDGTGNRRTTGFNGRYFGSDQPYTGESTKDYAAAGAQDASATKRRIVDRILAGEIVTRNKRSVWDVTTKPFKGAHFATFPPDLIEPCILAGSRVGDTVLDPFGGAGTTGLVAAKHGRNALLIELNPDYVKIARERIGKAA